MEYKKIYWLSNSKTETLYPKSTWYRCMKIEYFVAEIEKENEIVGITFSGNNIGFILKDK